jgi:hypothetical protein
MSSVSVIAEKTAPRPICSYTAHPENPMNGGGSFPPDSYISAVF